MLYYTFLSANTLKTLYSGAHDAGRVREIAAQVLAEFTSTQAVLVYEHPNSTAQRELFAIIGREGSLQFA